jgi:hypothetical protein
VVLWLTWSYIFGTHQDSNTALRKCKLIFLGLSQIHHENATVTLHNTPLFDFSYITTITNPGFYRPPRWKYGRQTLKPISIWRRTCNVTVARNERWGFITKSHMLVMLHSECHFFNTWWMTHKSSCHLVVESSKNIQPMGPTGWLRLFLSCICTLVSRKQEFACLALHQ